MVSRPSIVLVKKIFYNLKMNSSDFDEWKHDIYVKIFNQETQGVGVMSDLQSKIVADEIALKDYTLWKFLYTLYLESKEEWDGETLFFDSLNFQGIKPK